MKRAAACFICATSVKPEECKTDEEGRAVHEQCHVARLKLERDSAHFNWYRDVFAKGGRYIATVVHFPGSTSSNRGSWS